MVEYNNFIRQNVAPLGARRIGVYNEKGERVGQIPLKNLFPPNYNEKLYSFGAISDVHIVYWTADDDFKRALTFFNEREDVAFTCIAGDLTDNGTEEELAQYKAIVDSHSADTPIYAIAGNHEDYANVSCNYLQNYTGYPLYYTFTYGDDVYIMLGCYSWSNNGVFTEEYLQWIYETLESNRNKRCFIFEHVFPWGDSGNAGELYHFDMFSGDKGEVFQSLLRHYKNTVLFHGHSHLKFYLQEVDSKANYSDALGYRSIHIPSLAVPRDIEGAELEVVYADSEGYLVDVYKNGIHLRGRDFIKGEYLPIASYWIDTTLVNIEAGTYHDSTGTIIT